MANERIRTLSNTGDTMIRTDLIDTKYLHKAIQKLINEEKANDNRRKTNT